MPIDLKPCPFCGGEADKPQFRSINRQTDCGFDWYVVCSDCMSETHDLNLTPEEAAAAWNRRADQWVAVSEAYPEDGDCVLICHATEGHVGEAAFAVGEGGYNPIFTDTDDPFMVADPPPTHWRPLPAPPSAPLAGEEA